MSMRHTAASLCLLSWLISAAPASAVSIVVDPGHGGADPGNLGPVIAEPDAPPGGKCRESDLNYNVAAKVWNYIGNSFVPPYQTWSAILTKDYDETTPLQARADAAIGKDLFVSVHQNFDGVTYTIIEYDTTSYQRALWPASKRLATLIGNRMCTEYSAPRSLEFRGAVVDIPYSGRVQVLFMNRTVAVLGEPLGLLTAPGVVLCEDWYHDILGNYETDKQADGYRLGIVDFVAGAMGWTPEMEATAVVGGVQVAWTEPDPARQLTYTIDRAETCWGPWSQLASVAAGDPAYTMDGAHYTYADESVGYNGTCWYRVGALDEYSIDSCVVTGRNEPSLPGVPGVLSGGGVVAGEGGAIVALNWEPASGTVLGYHIYRSLVDNGASSCGEGGCVGTVVTSSFVDSTSIAGRPVYYWVRAFNGTGVSDPSEKCTVDVVWVPTASVGRSMMASEGIVAIYPTPVTRGGQGWVRFATATGGPVVLRLYDVAGRVICEVVNGQRVSSGVHEVQLEARDLGSGVYWVRLDVGKRACGTKRLVIVR